MQARPVPARERAKPRPAGQRINRTTKTPSPRKRSERGAVAVSRSKKRQAQGYTMGEAGSGQ